MSHYRLNLFIQPEHAKRLDELAAKKGVSKSSIVAAALASWLSPRCRRPARSGHVAKRLDRLSRQAERMERDQNIAIETLALFIRYYLTVSTPVPEAHQDAARAQGKARFEQFTEQLGPPPAARSQPGARRGRRNCIPTRCGWKTRGGSRASAGACVMSAVPQSMTATSLDRRHPDVAPTAMGPLIAAALEDPDVAEVMLNPDRTLWVDRL